MIGIEANVRNGFQTRDSFTGLSALPLRALGPFLLELRRTPRVDSKLPVPTPPMPYREKTPTGLATSVQRRVYALRSFV